MGSWHGKRGQMSVWGRTQNSPQQGGSSTLDAHRGWSISKQTQRLDLGSFWLGLMDNGRVMITRAENETECNLKSTKVTRWLSWMVNNLVNSLEGYKLRWVVSHWSEIEGKARLVIYLTEWNLNAMNWMVNKSISSTHPKTPSWDGWLANGKRLEEKLDWQFKFQLVIDNW